MKKSAGKLRLGIVGCGAIGSRIALSISKDLQPFFNITGVFDIASDKAVALTKRLGLPGLAKKSLGALILSSDVVVECVNTSASVDIVMLALKAQKRVLAMSVGRLFLSGVLDALPASDKSLLYLPSGAIAGLDGVKAARLSGIKSVMLTTRKPPAGFKGNVFLLKSGIDLANITADVVLYEGGVKEAVRKFPQNINVAAALAIAAGTKKIKVRIMASPGVKSNCHEIVCVSKSGIIRTIVENVPCPDNPKTSYLAVLSGIQVLRQLTDKVKIGT